MPRASLSIGSPLVGKATIRLNPKFYKGGTFTIIAHNKIVSGGNLEFEMNILPDKTWGTDLKPWKKLFVTICESFLIRKP
jgi:putative alpha-1,2-mannosidase